MGLPGAVGILDGRQGAALDGGIDKLILVGGDDVARSQTVYQFHDG